MPLIDVSTADDTHKLAVLPLTDGRIRFEIRTNQDEMTVAFVIVDRHRAQMLSDALAKMLAKKK